MIMIIMIKMIIGVSQSILKVLTVGKFYETRPNVQVFFNMSTVAGTRV